MPNFTSHAKFFLTGFNGNITIVKGSGENVVEFLVSGIFEIDGQNFFMTAERSYLPNSLYNRNFLSTKLACQLISVQKDKVFEVSHLDFSAIISNVKALEHLVSPKKDGISLSTVRKSGGVTSICLSHTLFAVNLAVLSMFASSSCHYCQKKNEECDPEETAERGMLPLFAEMHN